MEVVEYLAQGTWRWSEYQSDNAVEPFRVGSITENEEQEQSGGNDFANSTRKAVEHVEDGTDWTVTTRRVGCGGQSVNRMLVQGRDCPSLRQSK